MERIRKVSKEAFTNFGITGLEKIIGSGYEKKVINSENLETLSSNSDIPCVLYFNHSAKDDPFIALYLIKQYAPKRLDNLTMPVSKIQSEFFNYPQYSIAYSMGKNLLDATMPKVVQSYRLRDGEETSNRQLSSEAFQVNREFLKTVDEKMKEGTLLVISPEGHRSDTGSLLPAEQGTGFIAKKLMKMIKKGKIQDGIFVPVGFIFKDYKGPHLYFNPIKKPKLTFNVGRPLGVAQVLEGTKSLTSGLIGEEKYDAHSVSHFLMFRLSTLLPERMRGVYARDMIKDTLAGRYEIALKDPDDIRSGQLRDKWNGKFI